MGICTYCNKAEVVKLELCKYCYESLKAEAMETRNRKKILPAQFENKYHKEKEKLGNRMEKYS